MDSEKLARLYESIRHAPEGAALEFSDNDGETLWQVNYAVTPGNFMTVEITKQVVLQEDVEGIINHIRDMLHDWLPPPQYEGEEDAPQDNWEEDPPAEEQPVETWDEDPPAEEYPVYENVGDEGWSEPDDDEAEELKRVQEMLRMYNVS